MKLEDVLPAFREGKRIRRKEWIPGVSRHRTDGGMSDRLVLDDFDLEGDDWEVVGEAEIDYRTHNPENNGYLSLKEAVRYLKAGRTIQQRSYNYAEALENNWVVEPYEEEAK